MEYLIENFEYFLEQIEEQVIEDDYILFDCAGQLELYTHLEVMQRFINKMQNEGGFRLGSVYLMDVQVFSDYDKYISGLLMSTLSMMQLALPHATVVTKMDLLQDKSIVNDFQDLLYSNYHQTQIQTRYKTITNILRNIIIDHDLVSVQKLNLID